MWNTVVELWVPGVPAPQGSKKAFIAGKRAIIVDANPEQLKPWRSQVSAFALEAWGARDALDEPVCVHSQFVFPRPQSHYRTGARAGELRADAPHFKTTKPDKDKLERAIFDALTDAGVLRDDSRVVDGGATKVYGPKPGARVWIQTMTKEEPCER